MIYITSDADGYVQTTHYAPFDETYGLGKTREELSKTGIFVSSIPDPIIQNGKSPVMKVSQDGVVFYEYVVRPLTPEEEMQQIKEELTLTKIAIDDIIMGGMI